MVTEKRNKKKTHEIDKKMTLAVLNVAMRQSFLFSLYALYDLTLMGHGRQIGNQSSFSFVEEFAFFCFGKSPQLSAFSQKTVNLSSSSCPPVERRMKATSKECLWAKKYQKIE